MKKIEWWFLVGGLGIFLVTISGILSACDRKDDKRNEAANVVPLQTEAGPAILVDGSSTVHILSEGILDLFASRITTEIQLAVSGTGGGFKKFCRGQTDINGASRPITSAEGKLCEQNGVEFLELPTAFDGIAIVVPQSNDWVESLTVSELKKIWHPESEGVVRSWRDVRASFPDKPLNLYGPGIDSGTFDFFNDAINSDPQSSRADYKSSESDHELASLIAKDPNSLGYFGLAYHQKNEKSLRLIPIDDELPENGDAAVLPTFDTVANGEYQPLSRPLFLYVERKALERKDVQNVVEFYLRSVRLVAPDVGYIGLGRHVLSLAEKRLAQKKLGSAFEGVHSALGLTIADLMSAEDATAATKEE